MNDQFDSFLKVQFGFLVERFDVIRGIGLLRSAEELLDIVVAERNGVPFRFTTYTYYAFPMMLVSVAISHVYVWLRYF